MDWQPQRRQSEQFGDKEESKQGFVLWRKTQSPSSMRAAQQEHNHALGTMLPSFYYLIHSSFFFNTTQPTTHNRGCECEVAIKKWQRHVAKPSGT